MALIFSCPKCNSEIIVRYLHIGEEAECKSCSHKVVVPSDAKEIQVAAGDDTSGGTRTSSGFLPEATDEQRPANPYGFPTGEGVLTRIPSRQMPPRRQEIGKPIGPLGWLVLLSIAIGLVVLGYFVPWLLAVFAGLVIVGSVLGRFESRRLSRLAESRAGESICTFARSFDYRCLDTWILRAVYEELDTYYSEFPIRPADSFDEILHLDPEDLDDTAHIIAERAGRSMEDIEENPLCGKVETVEDLVVFLHHQPRIHTV